MRAGPIRRDERAIVAGCVADLRHDVEGAPTGQPVVAEIAIEREDARQKAWASATRVATRRTKEVSDRRPIAAMTTSQERTNSLLLSARPGGGPMRRTRADACARTAGRDAIGALYRDGRGEVFELRVARVARRDRGQALLGTSDTGRALLMFLLFNHAESMRLHQIQPVLCGARVSRARANRGKFSPSDEDGVSRLNFTQRASGRRAENHAVAIARTDAASVELGDSNP